MMNKILLLIGFMATFVFADDNVTYNQINFNVSAEQTVNNDLLIVSLYLQEDDKHAKRATKRVNQKMQSAFEIINQYPSVKHKTGNYNIHARYKDSKVIGWRARQDVHLESTNVESLTTLIQKLQPILLVSNTRFSISKPLTKQVKDELLLVLLDKFRQKANLIRKTLGAKSYKIVRLDVSEQSNNRPIYYSSRVAKSSLMASDAPAPKLSAGEGELKSSLNAVLELSFE